MILDMTVYYLHGGNSSFESQTNQDFYKELCKKALRKKVLLIPFAQGHDMDRESMIFKLKLKCKNENISVIIGSENIFILFFQILISKVIYVPGGDYCKLITSMSHLRYFRFLFHRKCIFGISSGADIWGDNCFSDDYYRVFPGLGFIKAGMKSHYNSLKDSEKIKKLKEATGDEDILLLRDMEFKKIESKWI